MAQTTGGLSMAIAKLEFSSNNSDWTDISGTSGNVQGTDQSRQSGEGYTFDGDTAIVTAGKREPMELQFDVVYTEGTAEAWELIRPYFEAGSAVYFRWSPKGGDSTEFQYTGDAGYITSFPYPAGDAASGDPIMGTWTYKTPKVTKAAVA